MEERKIPENVRYILARLKSAGFEAYVAGGAVRDSLSGKTPDDWDVCTSAHPREVAELFSEDRVIPTGIKHGTVTVVTGRRKTEEQGEEERQRENGKKENHEKEAAEKSAVEVTTFRRESGYSDRRHPDRVTFVSEIEEDLARRDFTVNAMAYSPDRGLCDPFGGCKDLENNLLRCVGEAGRRFSEDPLRILRALRFRAVCGFRLEKETEGAVRGLYENLKEVSWERITAELEKLMCGKYAAAVLDEYRDVFACLIPELSAMFGFEQYSPYHNRDVWHHTLAAVEDIPPVFALRMTMLLHDIAKPVVFVLDDNGRGRFVGHPQRGAEMAETILRRMRFPNHLIQRIVLLVRFHDVKLKPRRPEVRRMLALFGEKGFEDLLAVKHADAAGKYEKYLGEAEEKNEALRKCAKDILRDGDCLSVAELAVNGDDLIRAGVPAGPRIGSILKDLLEDVMDDTLKNEKTALLGAVKARMR